MLSLILIVVVSVCHALCFFLAARELERISNSPEGLRRFARLRKVWTIVLFASLAGGLALPASIFLGF